MKKLLAILAAAIMISFSAGAQETDFYPGWYFGVQGGANYVTSNKWGSKHLEHLNVPNLAFDLGYDFTPVFGLRGTLSGPKANYPNLANNKEAKSFNYAQLGLDATFDILNIFNPRADRGFSPYVFAGGAGYFRFKGANADKGAGLGARLGLGVNVRVNDRMSLSLEVMDNMMSNKFNTLDDNVYSLSQTPLQFKRPFPWDANVSALVGLKFKLGEK